MAAPLAPSPAAPRTSSSTSWTEWLTTGVKDVALTGASRRLQSGNQHAAAPARPLSAARATRPCALRLTPASFDARRRAAEGARPEPQRPGAGEALWQGDALQPEGAHTRCAARTRAFACATCVLSLSHAPALQVVVKGDLGTGKSSLLKRLRGGGFSPTYEPTCVACTAACA